MKLAGLQKLTLLDYPEKTACTVFTPGCNFRCPFCQNGSLVLSPSEEPLLPPEDFFGFLQKRTGLLDGVCISGGEPLLQPDLEDFCTRIHAMGFSVKLDTNGSNPERLSHLLKRGMIDFVAMDIKNSPEHYGETIGIPNFNMDPIYKSVQLLMEGCIPFEFRTTAVSQYHNEECFREIGQWLKQAPRYYIQCFRESPDVIQKGLSAPSSHAMEAFLKAVRPFIPSAQLRGI